MRRAVLLALGLLLLLGGRTQADIPWQVTTVTACQQVGVPAALALARSTADRASPALFTVK